MTIATLIQHLAECVPDLRNDYDNEDYLPAELLAVLLQGIRQARADLASWEHDVVAAIADRTTDRHFEVRGLGEVEVRRHTKRSKWNMDALLPVVVGRIMDDRTVLFDQETGELLPYAVIGTNLAARLRESIGMYSGKVTGLKALGVQVDEFCHEEPGEVQVVLPKRELV